MSADPKRFASAQALLALAGPITLHRLEGDNGRPIYIVTEGPYTKQLDDLDQVDRFVAMRTGRVLEAA